MLEVDKVMFFALLLFRNSHWRGEWFSIKKPSSQGCLEISASMYLYDLWQDVELCSGHVRGFLFQLVKFGVEVGTNLMCGRCYG